jgi:SAM-dependent methyltransferase
MSTSAPALPPQAAAAQLLTQLATGHMVASALQVVLRLGIPDWLARGPRTAAELAHAAGVREDGLYRVLRALASVGVFAETSSRRFALTAAGEVLVSGAPGSMRDMALWVTSPFHFRVYAELMHSVQTGHPAAEKVTGMPVFEYFRTQPELSEIFNDAMTNLSEVVVRAVLDVYDFSGIGVLVDVAGGHGAVLTTILNAYPRMRGVLFDLDHVVAGAWPLIEAMGVNDRCRTESGDFFKAVPVGGDAYIMKHIIHDWDDERAALILSNIKRAMKPGGRVILLDSVLLPANQPDFGKILDLEMLLLPGGRERTEEEFRALFARAGFRLTRIVPTRSPLSVIEAH